MKDGAFFEPGLYAEEYSIKEKDIRQCAELMSRAFHDDPSIRYLLGGNDMGGEDWRYFNTILKAVYNKCVMLSTDEKLNDLLILFPPQLKTVPAVGFFANGGASLPGLYSRGLLKRTINYEGNCKAVKSRFVSPEAWYCLLRGLAREAGARRDPVSSGLYSGNWTEKTHRCILKRTSW